jgi:hypothetical protein
MLTHEERDWVNEDLAAHVGLTSTIGNFILITFPGPYKTELGSIPVNLSTIEDQATWVVDACLSSRWRLNPSLLASLLQKLVNQGGKGRLAPILTRVQAQEDPNPDPFLAQWVMANQPFLGRLPLRTAAKQVIENFAQPILRVWGPSKTGKTYTTELLNHVMSESRVDLHVVSVEVTPESGPSYTVDELAQDLSLPMVNADRFPERSSSSYAKELCRWLIRNVHRQPGIWVFVLDGFAQKELADEVTDFIQALAQYIVKPEYSRRLRLILLDFDEAPMSGNWRAKTMDDQLTAGAITAIDIESCLTEFNTRMLAANRPDKAIQPADIPSVAHMMLLNSSSASCPLQKLYDDLLTIAR